VLSSSHFELFLKSTKNSSASNRRSEHHFDRNGCTFRT